jgi:hypothetical protein
MNPKILPANLFVGGVWTILVYHQVNTTTVLAPFKISVETQQGVNQCFDFCSNITNSMGTMPGFSDVCLCIPGY